MVQIKQMIVSKSIQNRLTYGGKNPVKYIMIHQTANTSKGANAYMHAKLQANGNSRQASWHYQVDADNIYQSFPDTAQAWHAGNRYYNQNSIGIELTVNSDGNYIGTVEHGAELVKYLMNKHNVPISNVIRHKDASGKYCPRELLDGKNGITWAKFKQMVQGASTPKPAPSKPSKPATPSKPANNTAKLVKNEDAYFLATSNIKVRNAPSTKATHTGTLKKGDSIHFYKVYEGNGYRWLQYVGNSGNKLYLPYRESGSGKEQWGTFHSSRPKGTSKPATKKIKEDGWFGPDTATLAQQVYGMKHVDGVISGQPNNVSTRNIPAAHFGSSGSNLIREMAKEFGVPAKYRDGKITNPSMLIEAMQKYYGTPVDKKVSGPSMVIKEWQKALNKGKRK